MLKPTNISKQSIIIIGSGPAALMLATQLDPTKFDIHIYEKNAAAGRKFLVAGDGGFNLTHSQEKNDFIKNYHPQDFIAPFLKIFSNRDLIQWLEQNGIKTFTGSSGRIFPIEGIKPIDVLNAFLIVLKNNKVQLHLKHEWIGWENENLVFKTGEQLIKEKSDFVVFALGGASWPVTGSDGSWANLLQQKNISITPFESSNAAIGIKWPTEVIQKVEGKVLKNISIRCGDMEKSGEVVITKFGLEGGAAYFINPAIREQLKQNGQAVIYVDLKPIYEKVTILEKLKAGKTNKSVSEQLKKDLHLNDSAVLLLKHYLTKEEFILPALLAEKIKQLPLTAYALAPIEEAISSVGGVLLDEVNEHLELKKLPNYFVIGEMLNWDVPTGGYLLQACFSMGYSLAKFLNNQ